MTGADSGLRPARLALTSFDRLVVAVLGFLIAATGGALALGDRVGVQLSSFGPVHDAGRAAQVTLVFSEEMDRDSVRARFRIDPAVAGEISWSGRAMHFRPAEEFVPGTRYEVLLDAGAESRAGRKLLGSTRFDFTVHGSRVAYLAPVDESVKNVWQADPLTGSAAEQLTRSTLGVVAFDPSPEGGRLAFAERNAEGGSDLKLLDLESRETRPLLACGANQCTNPAWSPDGRWVAFDRQASTPSAIPGFSRDATRVWLIDMAAATVQPRPLLDDPQIPTHSRPRWSPDGSRVAVDQPVPGSARGSPGVLVHDLETGTTTFYPASGPGGIFAADGSAFVFPALQPKEGRMHTVLRAASRDGEVGELHDGPQFTAPVEASAGPGPQQLTFALYPPAEERSAGSGKQLYVLDLGNESQPRTLLVDPAFNHSTLSWDRAGRFLAMERAAVRPADGAASYDARYQVWVYDAERQLPIQLATGAYRPKWIP